MKHWLSAALPLLLVSGCGDEEKTEYDLFNCEEDTTLIYVGIDEIWEANAGCPEGVDTITLRSSSCELATNEEGLEVGRVDISPCGGPVGTEHQVVVQINPIYKEEVDRASVKIDSGARGVEEYEMDPDSADEGLYKLTLISVGSEDELRNDVIQIKLWEEI